MVIAAREIARVDRRRAWPTGCGVASLLLEHFQAPAGTRDSRAFDRTRKRTLDDLAGRTVWCAGGAAAQHLRRHVGWSSGDGVRAEPLRRAEDLRPDDIVVLHRPLTAAPAEEIRQLGAHAVWHVPSTREQSPAVDAYLLTGTTADGAQVVAALVPAAGAAFAKAMRGSTYLDVGWGSLLAAIVRSDREECVGGTRHARPAVAPR
jgi:hypothetical protein